ncbi:MAG: two-component system, OmpR family, sensor histidine kinase MprB [Acidimicrobiaceae bacterium]
MTLRVRVAIAVAVIVAVAIAAAALLSYQGTSSGLRHQVDTFLDARAQRFTQGDLTLEQLDLNAANGSRVRTRFAEFDAVTQTLDRSGTVSSSVAGEPVLPVNAADVALAKSGGSSVLRDASVAGQHYRVLTVALKGGGAVQIARNLGETDTVLGQLRTRLVVIIGIGTALAALLALLVARRTARPIEHLRDAAERVADSGDLTEPIDVAGTGGREIGQLAVAFNTMLAALARARDEQSRLVADASHELRTPLTTVRTNIEFLERATTLNEAERHTLLAETRTELEELTDLVTEMVELATDTRTVEPVVDVDLPDLAADIAERFRRRSGRPIAVALGKPARVRAQRGLIERAVSNLVDNAIKFSDETDEVEITIDCTAIEVADRGSGIAPDDEEKVFDRFYRADNARTRPGSGLGLSIVAQIAEAHDATVTVRARPGGGTIARFELPST